MSFLIEKIVRVNGEEMQRSQVVAEYSEVERIELGIGDFPLIGKVELELKFDPPLGSRPAVKVQIDE